jgi:hypothetical protein
MCLNSNNKTDFILFQNYLNSLWILECLNYWNWFKINLKGMGKCTVLDGLHLAGPNQAGLAAHCPKVGEPCSQAASVVVAVDSRWWWQGGWGKQVREFERGDDVPILGAGGEGDSPAQAHVGDGGLKTTAGGARPDIRSGKPSDRS